MSLSPMPDKQTGEPRPPRAPLDDGWTPVETSGAPKDPADLGPPHGEGPTLEWHYERGSSFWVTTIIVCLLLAVVYTVVGGGFSWVNTWWLWLLFLCGPLLGLANRRGGVLAAGADWYRVGNDYVKTYELMSVQLPTNWASVTIELQDSAQRKAATSLLVIQKNRELWDLVYNGIRHSVANGAEISTYAATRLVLDEVVTIREQRDRGSD